MPNPLVLIDSYYRNAQPVFIVDTTTGNAAAASSSTTTSTVSDPPVEAALGTANDAAGAKTVIGQLIALVNTFKTAIAVTINGMLPAGTNFLGYVGGPLAAPITGQVKIATTGTAVQLPAATLVNGITITAKAGNAAQAGTYSSTVGGSTITTVNDGTGNGYPLAPGGSISFSSANANQIWVNGTAGDVFAYAAG